MHFPSDFKFFCYRCLDACATKMQNGQQFLLLYRFTLRRKQSKRSLSLQSERIMKLLCEQLFFPWMNQLLIPSFCMKPSLIDLPMCIICVYWYIMVLNFGSQQATRHGITYCAKGECTIEWGIELSWESGGGTEEDECSLDREECFPYSLEGANASWKSGILRPDITCKYIVNPNKLG